MRTKFQILFSVEILHDYYSTGRWDGVKIIPLPETEQLLRKMECQVRVIQNELIVIAKVDESDKVYHVPDLYQKFSFVLVPQTPGYLNYTNYPIEQLTSNVFCFNNLNGNVYVGKHFITNVIDEYSSTIDYNPGDIAQSTVDSKIYECISINPNGGSSIAPDDSEAEPANPPEPEDKMYSKNFWALLDDKQYVSKDDYQYTWQDTSYAISMAGDTHNIKASVSQTTHNVRVYAFNEVDTDYTKEVIAKNITYSENRNDVQLNMSSLPSGLYRIQVNNDVSFVYRDTSRQVYPGCMYIDIYNLPDTDEQAMLDAANKPKEIQYTVAFAARRVLWKYKTRTTAINEITDTSGEYLFKSSGSKQYISLRPIPFGVLPIKTLVANDGTNQVSPLPNPATDRLLDKQNGLFTTETFINY